MRLYELAKNLNDLKEYEILLKTAHDEYKNMIRDTTEAKALKAKIEFLEQSIVELQEMEVK